MSDALAMYRRRLQKQPKKAALEVPLEAANPLRNRGLKELFGVANVLEPDSEREMMRREAAPELKLCTLRGIGREVDLTKQEALARVREKAMERRDDGRRYFGSMLGRRWDQSLGCWVLDL